MEILGQVHGLDIRKNSKYCKIVEIVAHGDNDYNGKNRNWAMYRRTA